MLCFQPQPFPGFLAARAPQLTPRGPCRLRANVGERLLHMIQLPRGSGALRRQARCVRLAPSGRTLTSSVRHPLSPLPRLLPKASLGGHSLSDQRAAITHALSVLVVLTCGMLTHVLGCLEVVQQFAGAIVLGPRPPAVSNGCSFSIPFAAPRREQCECRHPG